MHQPFQRINQNANKVILFIHGFIGTPDHFQLLIPFVSDSWDIYNILLDGHGGTVDEFSSTSMEKWQQQVKTTIDDLKLKYDDIYLVGHSMGTLLELQYAIMNPSKIKGLFLLAVPLHVHVTPLALKNAIGTIFNLNDDHDEQLKAAKAMYSVEADIRFWKYIPWISRYFELFDLCKWVRTRINQLTIPTICIQSRKDELVQLRSRHYLENHSNIYVKFLNDSTHYYYTKEDKEMLCQIFQQFVKGEIVQ